MTQDAENSDVLSGDAENQDAKSGVRLIEVESEDYPAAVDTVQPGRVVPDAAQVLPPVRALRPAMFYLLVALVFLSDQISKAWIQTRLRYEESLPIFGDAFTLTLTHNTGGAWGTLPSANSFFILVAGFAAMALLIAYYRMKRVELFVGGAFALAMGGALGNLLDRLRYGYVVDFFDARFIHWPVFNVADSAITFGIVLLMAHFFRASRT